MLPFSSPFLFSLLGQVGGPGGIVLTTKPTMEYYLDFAEHMLLAFGFVFELPLFIGFLALAGIVTPQAARAVQPLRDHRRLRRRRVRHARSRDLEPASPSRARSSVSTSSSVGLAFLVAKRREM